VEAGPQRSRVHLPRLPSSTVHVVGLVLVVCGAGLVVSAVVDAVAGGPAAAALLACGAVAGVAGAGLRAVSSLPARLRAGSAFAAVVAAWATAVAVSTVAYLVTGTFSRLDDAVVESVAGFTTTAFSVLRRADLTTEGVLLWRALTQWFGGFAALVVIVAVLPSLGVGGLEGGERGADARSLYLRSPRVQALLGRLVVLYVVLTMAGAALYRLGGMTPFDALTYACTTISTGGFGNHPQSFRHFDSAVLEWTGIGGMVLAGANLALVWQGLRGATSRTDLGEVLRSTELRVYLAVLAVAAAAAVAWTVPDGGPTHQSVRHAVFSVTSVVSTTGHTVTDWGTWPHGAQAALMLLAGVGAMSGSPGGGFRQLRALVLVGYLRREVVRQLHPRAVLVVRVGRVVVPEAVASRMVAYQVVYLLVVAVGAVALALLGAELVTAASLSLSAVATVGPALAEASPGLGTTEVPAGARLALTPVMLLGRLEVTAVLVGVASLVRRGDRRPRLLRVGR
jgi:trk system potassium uptake protein